MKIARFFRDVVDRVRLDPAGPVRLLWFAVAFGWLIPATLALELSRSDGGALASGAAAIADLLFSGSR